MSKLRILYAIQGTGNGHLSRASAFVPHLLERGDLDLLVSGRDVNLSLNYPIKYRLAGAGFVFGRQGGIDWWKSLGIQRPWQFLRDSRNLPLHDYDLVINDFEPVSALAARRQGYTRMVSLSHQASFLSPKSPRPAGKAPLHAEWLFRHYARCPHAMGLHFEPYDDFIYTPVIRPGVRALVPSDRSGAVLVYLPSYGDKLVARFLVEQSRDIPWVLFSKTVRSPETNLNIRIEPASDAAYLRHMADAAGVLCGAGFETPAETLFLGKKLLVLPMKQQFEQACNAEALRRMGIPVGSGLNQETARMVRAWLKEPPPPARNWPDQSRLLLDLCFDKAGQ